MESTYMILGGDGKQYGPISAEQFRAWVADGRVNGATQVWRSGTDAWAPASSLPELGVAQPVSATAPVAAAMPPLPSGAPSTAADDPALMQQVKNGTSWFYWIGGLSLINSFAALAGSDWRFFIGLGITQFIEAFAINAGPTGKIIAIAFALLAAGSLIAFGILGGKGHGWAMLVGAILLGLDGIIVALAALGGGGSFLWISFAFHAWAIFMIWRGFLALRQMKR